MDEATSTALTTTAKRYYEMVARGDSSSLRQNAIASLASNFSEIENAVKENQANLSGVQAVARPAFLLKAEGTAPLERAEFLCGVFGAHGQTRDSAVFVIPNLPPGNYGIVTLDAPSSQGAYTVSFVLQQSVQRMEAGGFYAKPAQISGHDGDWFADRARDYKVKGALRNAWFYFGEARELLVPVPFMATATTDKLYDEMQAVKPSGLPPLDLASGGKSYRVTDLFPSCCRPRFRPGGEIPVRGYLRHREDLSGQSVSDESAVGRSTLSFAMVLQELWSARWKRRERITVRCWR